MKRTFLLLMLLSSVNALMLSGCTATGPQFQPLQLSSPGALLYVFRPNKFANSALTPSIALDGRKVGILRNGGYLALSITEGSHVLMLPFDVWNWNIRCDPLSIEIKPETTYYVALDTDASVLLPVATAVVASRTCRLHLLPEHEALPLIHETHLSE